LPPGRAPPDLLPAVFLKCWVNRFMECCSDQLGAEADPNHRAPAGDRGADERLFRYEERVLPLIVCTHQAAEDDEMPGRVFLEIVTIIQPDNFMRLLPLFQVLFNYTGRLIRPVLEDGDHRYRMGGGAP